MRLTEEVKQQLESELPPSAAVREELRNYLALTGMSAPEFADACSRSRNAIRFFLKDTYNLVAESDLFVRKSRPRVHHCAPGDARNQGSGKAL